MSPSDLPPEGQEIFARLSKRWAEKARREAKPARQPLVARLVAFLTTRTAFRRRPPQPSGNRSAPTWST